jgi:hypothetical protein
LSEVRDAKILVETLDKLVERDPDRAALGLARTALLANQRMVREQVLERDVRSRRCRKR